MEICALQIPALILFAAIQLFRQIAEAGFAAMPQTRAAVAVVARLGSIAMTDRVQVSGGQHLLQVLELMW